MKRVASIQSGKLQALTQTCLGREESIPEFLNRFILLNKELNPDVPCHIAAHLIKDLNEDPEPYVHAHNHPSCDEIGLIIGQPGALEYEIVLGEEVHRCSSPASVFIPAGTVHRARAIRGNGAYVCILMDAKGPHSENCQRATEGES